MERISLCRKGVEPIGVLKWKLFRSKGKNICKHCGKICDDNNMDHIIPVFIGGSLRNRYNLQIKYRNGHGRGTQRSR